ncbi:MAG: ribonuclease III [Firmicutes bacterium]|nr:ribonuclease III [Bacillota bacterium]
MSGAELTPAGEELRQRLGFSDTELPLLVQALTHPAFFEGSRHHREGDNQRLEFLGDAVLDLIAGEYLFRAYPEAQEGELSKMRAFIVCEASLAAAAVELGVDQALRLGHGSEAGGDRRRPSVLADAFEAVVGAVFTCRGYAAARELFLSQFREKMDRLTPEDYEDKKSLLQELVQARVSHGVSYRLLGSSGPDHAPTFESAVYCGRLLLGQGRGRSKKESEVAAATAALQDREQWLDRIE